MTIRLLSARAGRASETITASARLRRMTIVIRLRNGTALSEAIPPHSAGNQKTKLSKTDAIAPTSAPASVARGQNRPSRKDRKSVVWGKSVSVRVDTGGRRIIKTNKQRDQAGMRREYKKNKTK